MGSPVWLLILALQYARSPSSPALSPQPACLFCTHPSDSRSFFFQVSLSSSLSSLRALLPSSSHEHTVSVFSLFRCLRYFRRSSNVFVPDLILPGHPPPPHIHLSNRIPSILVSCHLVMAHVSAPYSIAVCHNTPLHLFQFLHAALTRFAISVSIPPSSSQLSMTVFTLYTIRDDGP